MRRLLAIIFMLMLLMPGIALAQPSEVEVGTYVLNIGKYDLEHGSYTIDFYLWFWSNDVLPEDLDFEFMNGRAKTIDQTADDPDYRFYRIEAEMYENGDLRNYPSDVQQITIKLEDKGLNSKDLVFVPNKNESGISPEIVMPGWDIVGDEIIAKNVTYKIWGEEYSRYIHAVKISRVKSSFYEILIPLICIVIIGWLCFFLPLDDLGERLFITGSSLIAAVAFHIYVTSSIPATGYLTMADKMILSAYSMIVFMLIGFTVTDFYKKRKRSLKMALEVNTIFRITALVIPFAIFMLLSLL